MTYSLRLAEPRDVGAIEERCHEQNVRDGTNYPVPPLFDKSGQLNPMIALAVVIEDERGELVQAAVFERMFVTGDGRDAGSPVEMLLFGCDPHATAQLEKQIDGCFYLLRRQGYSLVHTFVPKDVVIPIEKPLQRVGYRRVDGRLAHFVKDLAEEET